MNSQSWVNNYHAGNSFKKWILKFLIVRLIWLILLIFEHFVIVFFKKTNLKFTSILASTLARTEITYRLILFYWKNYEAY